MNMNNEHEKRIQFLVECLNCIELNNHCSHVRICLVGPMRKKYTENRKRSGWERAKETPVDMEQMLLEISPEAANVTNSFGLDMRARERLWPKIEFQISNTMNLMIIWMNGSSIAFIASSRSLYFLAPKFRAQWLRTSFAASAINWIKIRIHTVPSLSRTA